MEQNTPTTTDGSARAELADVLERFLAGNSTISRLAGDAHAFLVSRDHAVAMIAETCCDFGTHDLRSRWRTHRSLLPKEQALLERCCVFLRTSLAYEWPDLPNLLHVELGRAILAVLGVAVVGHLLFGVIVLFMGLWPTGVSLIIMCIAAGIGVVVGYRALRQWEREQCDRYTDAGDAAVWPFLRRGDYEQAMRYGDPTSCESSPLSP